MVQPPVTLDEFRRFLNLDDNDVKDDEERWGKLVAATELVEGKVGAMRVRTVQETVRSNGCWLQLAESPLLDLQTVGALDVTTLDVDYDGCAIEAPTRLGSPRYPVSYVVGREPIPYALMEATMIVAEQLWQSQRGPAKVQRGTQGDNQQRPRGFAWPNRALELISGHEKVPTLA